MVCVNCWCSKFSLRPAPGPRLSQQPPPNTTTLRALNDEMVTGNRDRWYSNHSSSSNLLLMSSIYHDAIATKRSRGRIYSVPYHKHTPNTTPQHHNLLCPDLFKNKPHTPGSFLKPRNQYVTSPAFQLTPPDPPPVRLLRHPDFLGYRLRLLLIASPPQRLSRRVRAPERLDKPRGAFHLATGTSARWVVSL